MSEIKMEKTLISKKEALIVAYTPSVHELLANQPNFEGDSPVKAGLWFITAFLALGTQAAFGIFCFYKSIKYWQENYSKEKELTSKEIKEIAKKAGKEATDAQKAGKIPSITKMKLFVISKFKSDWQFIKTHWKSLLLIMAAIKGLYFANQKITDSINEDRMNKA